MANAGGIAMNQQASATLMPVDTGLGCLGFVLA
jgi:hypothetical protein